MPYTSQEFCKLVRVPYRTLMGWVETGLIHPYNYRGGRRVQTYFSDKDLKEVRVLKALRRYLSGQSLRKAIHYLRDRLGHNPFSSGDFLVIGKDLVKICNEREAKQAISLIRQSGQLLILPCVELKKEYNKQGV